MHCGHECVRGGDAGTGTGTVVCVGSVAVGAAGACRFARCGDDGAVEAVLAHTLVRFLASCATLSESRTAARVVATGVRRVGGLAGGGTERTAIPEDLVLRVRPTQCVQPIVAAHNAPLASTAHARHWHMDESSCVPAQLPCVAPVPQQPSMADAVSKPVIEKSNVDWGGRLQGES